MGKRSCRVVFLLLLLSLSFSLSILQQKSLTLRRGAGDHQGNRDRGEEEAGGSHFVLLVEEGWVFFR
jgi:hypothetical protein